MKIADLNNSLGIDRSQLPQINSQRTDEIVADLQSQNIPVQIGNISVSKLTPTQDKIRLDKVKGMIDAGKHDAPRKIFISKEGYILDGHHHWAANKAVDPDRKIKAIMIGLDVNAAIDWLNASPIAIQKSINEETNHELHSKNPST